MPHATLVPHPSTPCPAVTKLTVEVTAAVDGGLALTYRLTGDPGTLLIPSPATPARVDGLWRHTCFEVFVMAGNGPAYREFNFSPSGEWAAYAFSTYRDGGPLEPAPTPTIACRLLMDGLELIATLPASALPESAALKLGLSVVIKDRDGGIAYWALRHAPGKPDFHHTDAFALTLDLI